MDNEPTLKTEATGAAAKIGNMTVTQTSTYSSNSQGSVERFHRTLFGQVKFTTRASQSKLQEPHDQQVSSTHAMDNFIAFLSVPFTTPAVCKTQLSALASMLPHCTVHMLDNFIAFLS